MRQILNHQIILLKDKKDVSGYVFYQQNGDFGWYRLPSQWTITESGYRPDKTGAMQNKHRKRRSFHLPNSKIKTLYISSSIDNNY